MIKIASDRAAPKGYRPCAGIMLINKDNRIFVGQRIDTPYEAWQMPQGGIEENESIEAACARELEEEVGTTKAELIKKSRYWMTYDLPESLRKKLWGGLYRGQAQCWCAFRFLGSDDDIQLDTPEPEFQTWQWIEPQHLVDVIVPFKRDIYETVLREFKSILDAS